MLEERGIVVEVNEKFAFVQSLRHTNSCTQCFINKNCSTASLTAVLGQKYTKVKVINQLAAKVGDKVIIGLEEQVLLKSSLALYLFPLLGMFIAAIGFELIASAARWPNYEINTVLAGLLGLFTTIKLVRIRVSKMSEDTRYQPMIVKIK